MDAKFAVKRDFISRIKANKVIIENRGSADDIAMVISNWSPTKSTASLILPNFSSLRNSHGSIITFIHDYTKYITTKCLYFN